MGNRYIAATLILNNKFSAGMKKVTDSLNRGVKKFQSQNKVIRNFGKNLETKGKTMKKFGDGMTRSVTLPLVGAGIASGKLYMDFNKNMQQINTLLDDSSHLKSYERAVLNTAKVTGITAEDSAQGMYQTISVLGDHGRKTQKTFEIMAKAAKAGKADTIDSVNMIATAMNGYGKVSDKTAQRVSDLSFKTVKLGKTTFPELANSMSPLFPLGKNLGLSYEELYATMSTATTSFAGNTAEATTQIKGLMTGFLKPSKDMQELMKQNGYSSGAAMIKAKGLAGALELVQKHAGKDGMPKYFKNVRGLTAALGLSGKGLEKFKNHLKEMQNAMGATNDAFRKNNEADAEKWHHALVNLQVAAIKFGGQVLPVITPMIVRLGNAVGKAGEWFNGLSKSQQNLIVRMLMFTVSIGPVFSVLGRITGGAGRLISAFGKMGAKADAAGGIIKAFGRMPFMLAGMAVVAMLIVRNWSKIKPVVMEVWKALTPIRGVIAELGGLVMSVVATIWPVINKLFVFLVKVVLRSIILRIKYFTPILKTLVAILKWVFKVVKSVFGGIAKIIKIPINAIISGLNFLTRQINKIGISFPKKIFGIKLPKAIAGKGWHFNIPQIPKLARGTNSARGGTTLVGEEGPELVNLPRGTQVKSNRETKKFFNTKGGNSTVVVKKLADTIIVREEADIERIADRLADKLKNLSEDYVGA